MLYCQSHHSYRAIWNAKTRLQKPHVSPLLWFSWPRAHFKSWFRKVRFVSEKEQGKSWLHNDLRNCHPNVEGGLSATDAGILLFKTLLHKLCCSASLCENQRTQSGYHAMLVLQKQRLVDMHVYQLYRGWHVMWWTSETAEMPPFWCSKAVGRGVQGPAWHKDY